MSNEPTLGIGTRGIRYTNKPDSKIVAFVDIIVPTKDHGDLTIRNFKIVRGKDGLFVSPPNRAGKVEEGKSKPRYYNDLRFENYEKYSSFRKVLDETVLPRVNEELDQKKEVGA